MAPGAPKSVVAEPGSRSTTSNDAAALLGIWIPAAPATTTNRGAYAASASSAASSSLLDRHQPGQSAAEANTRFDPISRYTAVATGRDDTVSSVDLKLAVMAPIADGLITSGSFLQEFAGTLEEAGVESMWTVEHVVVAEHYDPKYPYSQDGQMPSGDLVVPIPDPLDLLAYIAGATTTLKLGTAVVVAPLHSPAILAKRAATIDILSAGRLLLGLGIGWQREEYAAVGVPFQERGRRLDECVEAMQTLWADAPATYHGRHVSFDRVFCEPRPPSRRV